MEVRLKSADSLQIQLSTINASGAVTVKDVAAKEFIDAFSKHLKKGNKIKMPDVSHHSSYSFPTLVAVQAALNLINIVGPVR